MHGRFLETRLYLVMLANCSAFASAFYLARRQETVGYAFVDKQELVLYVVRNLFILGFFHSSYNPQPV